MTREERLDEALRHTRPIDRVFPERKNALLRRTCVHCGEHVNISSMDEITFREYGISAFCKKCQDASFEFKEPSS